MNPVAVVGGGITGLTAAFRLKSAGIPVTLYEPAARVGGPIRSVQESGYLAECGPNTLLETSPCIGRLVEDLSLTRRRIYANPAASNRYIVKGGKPVALPGGFGGFLNTPLFSMSAKVRLFAEPFLPRSLPNAEESVADFVLRRLGQEFLDYAINPLVAGVYAGDPRQLSVQHAFPKLHQLEQRYGSLIRGQIFGAAERRRRGAVSKQNAPKFSFDAGLELLPKTLHARLEDSVRLEQKVTSILRRDQGWDVVATNSEGQRSLQRHSSVIVAVPAYALAELTIDGSDRAGLSRLAEIVYPPVATAVFGFRREDVAHPLDGFGVLVPEVERMNILGTIFSSSLFPGRAPEGHVTLSSYVGGCRAPELALQSRDRLLEKTLSDIRKLFGVKGEPAFEHCTVFRRAIPQYNVGFGRFKKAMDEMEERAPGVFIGGQCRCGISLGDSIESGFHLAERAMQHLATIPVNHETKAAGAPNRLL